MDNYGYLWITMDNYGYHWITMDNYGYLWITMDNSISNYINQKLFDLLNSK